MADWGFNSGARMGEDDFSGLAVRFTRGWTRKRVWFPMAQIRA